MNGFWTGIGAVQQAAIALTSTWNAAYFASRLHRGPLPRRIAAGVLALLFAAIAVEAAAGLPVAATTAEVARCTPLLLATVTVAYLVAYRPIGGAR